MVPAKAIKNIKPMAEKPIDINSDTLGSVPALLLIPALNDELRILETRKVPSNTNGLEKKNKLLNSGFAFMRMNSKVPSSFWPKVLVFLSSNILAVGIG